MDWQTIISQLLELGMTQQQIADRCGTSQSYVSDLYRGTRGKHLDWDIGNKLLDVALEKGVLTDRRHAA